MKEFPWEAPEPESLRHKLARKWSEALSRGVHPLDIVPGDKAPVGRWAGASFPHDGSAPLPSTQSIGFKCYPAGHARALAALDFDTETDTYRKHAAFEHVPVRYRDTTSSKRFLVPFVPVGAGWSRGRNVTLPCGADVQLLLATELNPETGKARNRQFVAHGMHVSGVEYRWDNEYSPFPKWTVDDVTRIVGDLGGALTLADEDAPVDVAELEDLRPRTEHETDSVRRMAADRIEKLKAELSGLTKGRGDRVFAASSFVSPAEFWGLISRDDIERAVEAAGHDLDRDGGSKPLRDEIISGLQRGLSDMNPILRMRRQGSDVFEAARAAGVEMTGFDNVDVSTPTPHAPRGRTLGEVKALNIPPPTMLIDGLLTDGAVLLTARPKLGKSNLAFDIAFCIAEGKPFWGRSVLQGSVVYLALEEGLAEVSHRYNRMRPNGSPAAESIHVFTQDDELNVRGERLVPFLEAQLQRTPDCRLVVIDVLGEITAETTDKNKSLYQRDRESVDAVRRFAKAHKITVLILHHNNKSGGKDGGDASEAISGSTGLPSAVNGSWVITERDGTATLSTRMRSVKSEDILVEIKDGTIKPLDGGTLAEPGADADPRSKIAFALSQAGCEASPSDVKVRCPGLHEKAIENALSRMDAVEKIRRGLYVLKGTKPCTREQGAAAILAGQGRQDGTLSDYQAHCVVPIRAVAETFKNNDRTPVVDGWAVSQTAALALLSGLFAKPADLLKSAKEAKVIHVFDGAVLIPSDGRRV